MARYLRSVRMPPPNHTFIVADDPANCAAEALVALLAPLDEAAIAVSGGSTPCALFRLLASTYRCDIDWTKVSIFQVDERCVPPAEDASNWKMLREELLDHVPGVSAYRMEAERKGAAEDYESLIRTRVACSEAGVPTFDLVLLGMGDDGHTASLFPGTNALNETERLVVRNCVPQQATDRVTMTFPIINAARRRWFLVAGEAKAPALTQVRNGDLPAGRVSDATWFVDTALGD
ncbi:MAG: 6-phosphogluconolactonase [bacterium]|nr:6-phosphogluconolactonase [bacterium]